MDNIEVIGAGTIIQHGPLNNRIYLMKLAADDCPGIIEMLDKMAARFIYTKIICKVPVWAAPLFLSGGYVIEGFIPCFYRNKTDVFFVSKFIDRNRRVSIEKPKFSVLSDLLNPHLISEKTKSKQESTFKIRRLKPTDAKSIADVYKIVFKSYPFPIHDEGYIVQTMNDNVQYYGIDQESKLIAIASSEVDEDGLNAEMTDFATLPEYRGKSLAAIILNKMEKKMKRQGISTLYTIARLNSPAMNKTFQKLDYSYSGTLINNTNIAGAIESMNIYYKHI